jgi:hypothetical protein
VITNAGATPCKSFASIGGAYGWLRSSAVEGGMRKARFRGLARVAWQFVMTAAALNLWRLPKLQAVQT